jgi:hypothetical protein
MNTTDITQHNSLYINEPLIHRSLLIIGLYSIAESMKWKRSNEKWVNGLMFEIRMLCSDFKDLHLQELATNKQLKKEIENESGNTIEAFITFVKDMTEESKDVDEIGNYELTEKGLSFLEKGFIKH